MHEKGLFSVREDYKYSNNKKNHKNIFKYLIIYLIIFISLLGLFFGIVYLFNNKDNTNNKKIIKFTNTSRLEVINTVSKVSNNIKPYVNEIPNYRNNYGNSNIMGRLVINSLGIDTMVVRGSDNSYYLNRNLYNVYDGIGAPFFDYRNTDLVNSKQINIYGHNTQNDKILDKLPLAKLINFSNQDTFNNSGNVDLYTDNEHITYEIIGIKIIQKTNNYHMTINFNSDEDFINHSNKLLSDLLYSRDTNIDKDDRLLVLQTCNYNPENTLMLVICKEI